MNGSEQLRFDTLIIGGGMVGMSLALALKKAGARVALVEREPLARRTPDTRVSAIALGQAQFLDQLGVWEAIAPQAQAITDLRVTDGHSPVFLHYHHREVGDAPFGYIVENNVTRSALSNAVAASEIAVFAPSQLAQFLIHEGMVHAQLQHGQQLHASLIIGAEGRRSRVREALGIATTKKNYAQTAIVATIGHTLPHHGLAQERFLAKGPFAVLPMTMNRSSLVWVEPSALAPAYAALAKPDLEQEIITRIGDYLGEVTLLDAPSLYPLSLEFAQNYVHPRAALVGDAAHGIHPIAGQGVNLGLRDAQALAEILAERIALGLDVGALDGLTLYEQARRADNLAMIAGTDAINALFSNNHLPLKILRSTGLLAVSKMPALKRAFIKHAMGVRG